MPKAKAKTADFYRIRCNSGESFRRAGLALTREGIVVDGNDLSEAQREALAKEPNVSIEPIEADEAEAAED